MNTFSIITNALAESENDPDKAGLDEYTIMVGRVIAAVQKVVDALTPPDGGRYVVALADISTAGTSLGERRITVSSKPLNDKALTLIEKAVVIATFAAHEIGHTLVTRPRDGAAQKHNTHSGYHAVANLADDIILEPFMADRYPILKDAFAFTGLWVLRTTSPVLPKVHTMQRSMSTPERFNVVLSATRYPDLDDIVFSDDVTKAERDWSRGWAQRLGALRISDHAGFLALCDEVWERIREEAPEEAPEPIIEEPEQGGDEPTPGESNEQDEGDESESEGSESEDEGDESEAGDSESEDEGEGASDDATDGDDATESEDEGDEPGKSTSDVDMSTDGSDMSTDDAEGDAEGGSEGSGESMEQPEGADWDDVEGESEDKPTSDDGHIDGGDPADGDSTGGGGNAEATAPPLRDEDDFNKGEVEQSMHEQAEQDPWSGGSRVEQAVRTYANTTVTAFGVHGTLPTEWS